MDLTDLLLHGDIFLSHFAAQREVKIHLWYLKYTFRHYHCLIK